MEIANKDKLDERKDYERIELNLGYVPKDLAYSLS
jgi:hypothetical protein